MKVQSKPTVGASSHSALAGFFRRFARGASDRLGSTWSFIAALGVVVAWAVTGPLFHYSDTWQLAINTGTTIVTFLMVFLIQNAQNRDAVAIHLKLDELIRAVDQARNGLVDLENRSDEEIREVREEFADFSNACSPQAMAHTPSIVSAAADATIEADDCPADAAACANLGAAG